MKLRVKVILLAVVPLILAICAITLAVWHHEVLLAQQQRASIQKAYLASKEAEIKHYVTLAVRSVAHLYISGRTDDAALNEAKQILTKLEFGEDDYFFVYDLHGTNLVHPRLPELIGRNLWEMRDVNGVPVIQELVERAKSGGGVVRYSWPRPSTHKSAPKLGYVVELERWGWIVGTGIYLDYVDAALDGMDAQISSNTHSTMLWIAGIAILGTLIIAFSGLALNISDYRVADAKLRILAQRVVHSQEDERARLSRDLHDGIGQALVSVKLQIESSINKLRGQSPKPELELMSLDKASQQVNVVLSEVRRISHDLRPALLDDLGLAPALRHLMDEFASNSSCTVGLEFLGNTDTLPDAAKTVLFRIAQEALTNIHRHAAASCAFLHLVGDKKNIQLTITDDGKGFDVVGISQHPKRGIGLRNMHERLKTIGGTLQLDSSPSGTRLMAILPRT